MTVIHNVLMKFRDPAMVKEVEPLLRGMTSKIEDIQSLEVGIDQLGTPRSYHLALVVTLEDWEALRRYAEHPVHKPVVARIAEIAESVAVVDYESPNP